MELMCIVNPVNPTGDFLPLEKLKIQILESVAFYGVAIIDESMLFWFGPDWKQHSLVNQIKWIKKIKDDYGIDVIVIHSWTKIFSCPGLRIGSLFCNNLHIINEIRKLIVPWNVNSVALSFLGHALKEDEYLMMTWKETKSLRCRFVEKLGQKYPSWKFYGEEWLSYIWIELESEENAEHLVEKCKENGYPIRWGKPGYGCPSFVRIAVRDAITMEDFLDVL
eukprot:GHVP01025181.1.p1 GENE.GHVP01025181.1~~GHVP01025181.1.p1  ORF type:complete len:222 (-),score=33.85 GHVP01025181.1:70-735(-)